MEKRKGKGKKGWLARSCSVSPFWPQPMWPGPELFFGGGPILFGPPQEKSLLSP